MPAKRHVVAAVVLAAHAGVWIGGAGAARAQEATPATGPTASIDKVGWWNTSRGPQPGEPDNPVRPALAPAPPPPTNVPADAVGVGAALGEATKVAAVGILLAAAPGSTADTLTLTLKESPAAGANIAADQAGIVACPITGFWGETRNGSWVDRPTADCTVGSVTGARAADGTWTFDLVPFAPLWLNDGGPGQNGVLLMEAVDAPGGFETSFLDPTAGGMTLSFAASGGDGASGAVPGDVDASSAVTDAVAPPPVDNGGAALDLGRSDPFRVAPRSGPPDAPPLATPAGGPAARASRGGRTTASATGRRAGDLIGNVSPATLLLIPFAVVLAAVLSLALGDATATVAAPSGAVGSRRRVGGVSRALARRERPADLLTTDNRP